MTATRARQLMIIGGAEEKNADEATILAEFVRRAGGERANIVIMPTATRYPERAGNVYEALFQRLGAGWARTLDIRRREEAQAPTALDAIREASGVFFTGGGQLRITSLLGGTPVAQALHERCDAGMVIAGTSAGASMMSDTMLISGNAETNPRVEIVDMSPGMGFLPGVVVDQHFAQRGRIGRLLAAVAQHPGHLGLGIDEDTAVIVDGDTFRVMGSGAVTVVDATEMFYTNLPEVRHDACLALCGIRLHILPDDYRFDLARRAPILVGKMIGG